MGGLTHYYLRGVGNPSGRPQVKSVYLVDPLSRDMPTFLAGGTGTPKLLWGTDPVFDPATVTVVGNTGDDVELGGLLVCPDLDTVLYERSDELDRETWWGRDDDPAATHEAVQDIAAGLDRESGPRFLPPEAQTSGRDIARWRRFSAVPEFMHIGDRDRAVHLTRSSLKGHVVENPVAPKIAKRHALKADVPTHLKDGNRDKEGFGQGRGYHYPHANRDHWVAQQYLPEALQGKHFYEPLVNYTTSGPIIAMVLAGTVVLLVLDIYEQEIGLTITPDAGADLEDR